MSFNSNKCIIIRTTQKNKEVIDISYKLNGNTQYNVDNSIYLGVTISNNLSWVRHFGNIVGKGNKTLGFIRRNLKDCTNQ